MNSFNSPFTSSNMPASTSATSTSSLYSTTINNNNFSSSNTGTITTTTTTTNIINNNNNTSPNSLITSNNTALHTSSGGSTTTMMRPKLELSYVQCDGEKYYFNYDSSVKVGYVIINLEDKVVKPVRIIAMEPWGYWVKELPPSMNKSKQWAQFYIKDPQSGITILRTAS